AASMGRPDLYFGGGRVGGDGNACGPADLFSAAASPGAIDSLRRGLAEGRDVLVGRGADGDGRADPGGGTAGPRGAADPWRLARIGACRGIPGNPGWPALAFAVQPLCGGRAVRAFGAGGVPAAAAADAGNGDRARSGPG